MLLIEKFISHGVPVEIYLEDEDYYTQKEKTKLINEFLGVLLFGHKYYAALRDKQRFESHNGEE